MFRQKPTNSYICASIFLILAANFLFAQSAELVRFEKSIDEGRFSEIELEVLGYAIKNPKDAKAFELLGKIRLKQKRFGEARSLFLKAIDLEPGSHTAKIGLAEAYFKMDDPANAKRNLGEIPESNDLSDEIRLRLAETYSLVGDCERALSIAEKLSFEFRNSKALPLRAKCLIKTDKRAEVISLIPLAKKLSREHVGIALNFAEVLSNAGFYRLVKEVLQPYAEAEGANEKIYILLAKAEIFLRDFDSAKIRIARAEKSDPGAPELLFVKGLLELAMGNSIKSLELFEKYMEIKPDSANGLSQLVIASIRANQANKGVKAAEKLLEIDPDEPRYVYLHGAASLQSGKIKDAEASLQKFMKMKPEDSRGCVALGLAYAAQSEKIEIARGQMRKCLEINPNNYEAKYQLGLSYKAQGETKKAIPYLEEVVAQKGDYSIALRDLGVLYLQSGAEMKARVMLEKAAALSPEDSDTHFQLSRLYNIIGETELAKKHLKIFQDLRKPKDDIM